ncbi:hypothetical protein MLD38_029460 [Melastoma candidum]|uniref:Uncharacterized protein n=1 Tax=Melastoma candidum TaxID=119954 RepID=A0ACB9N3T2_9MYRT|nr:hypothetical protein MLD38_029460 [Melastoma candidum]
MGCARAIGLLGTMLLLFLGSGTAQDSNASTTLFPAIFTFGDSAADPGNNDYLPTVIKANYPPYGRDFADRKATGRFCNGKLATDIAAETLGFTAYPLPYLSPEALGEKLLVGASFASAASGYNERAATMNHALTLNQQLQLFEEYQRKLAEVAGINKAVSIVKEGLYLVSAGTGDFLQNYYLNPYLSKACSPEQYASIILASFTRFIKGLYLLGARKIGVTSLPPIGCFPVAITLLGYGQSRCVSQVNADIQGFNKRLNLAAASLRKQLPGVRIVIFDIFTPLYELIKSPSQNGFAVVRRGCCGTETTIFLCNPKSFRTCPNATKYVFWDSVHPTQAANQFIAEALILQGISLL